MLLHSGLLCLEAEIRVQNENIQPRVKFTGYLLVMLFYCGLLCCGGIVPLRRLNFFENEVELVPQGRYYF